MDLSSSSMESAAPPPSFHTESAFSSISNQPIHYLTNQSHQPYHTQYQYHQHPQDEEDMEDEFDEDTLRQMQDVSQDKEYFTQQMSMAEYEKQTREYTSAAVDALVKSPEYQRVFTRCQLCWCSWSENQFNESCLECGGFAMSRPCPICSGKCGTEWKREVQMSHSAHEAHWDGECSLPWKEKEGYMFQNLIDDVSEDSLLDGIEDLTT